LLSAGKTKRSELAGRTRSVLFFFEQVPRFNGGT
jgi:hypothetical protein